jgi:hypothetical protein
VFTIIFVSVVVLIPSCMNHGTVRAYTAGAVYASGAGYGLGSVIIGRRAVIHGCGRTMIIPRRRLPDHGGAVRSGTTGAIRTTRTTLRESG